MDKARGINILLETIRSIRNEKYPEVETKLTLFSSLKTTTHPVLFRELCFCILTANTSSEMGTRVLAQLTDKDLLELDLKLLNSKLKTLSCRFYNKRSEYIVLARNVKNLKVELEKYSLSTDKRVFLARTVKGIGFKESSHFLRNTGHFDLAILDKHVKNILYEHNIISERLRSKSLTESEYLEIENKLAKIAKTLNMTQGELDYYLWYMKTKKILK